MVTVTGRFEVRLRTSIPISVDFWKKKSFKLQFSVDGIDVILIPSEYEEPFEVEGELIEGPSLLMLWVIITKEVSGLQDSVTHQIITRDDRLDFESIMIKATSRFVAALKSRLNLWQLDHRLPVDGYRARYSVHGGQMEGASAGDRNSLVIPEEVARAKFVGFRLSDFVDELTEETWGQISYEVQKPVAIDFHEEAIFDAKVFRQNLSFDAAVLYSAFACESILRDKIIELLEKSGRSRKRRNTRFIDRINGAQLVQLCEALYDGQLPKFGGQPLEELFTLRNKVAHRRQTGASAAQANDAIGTAEQLKQLLEKV